MTTTTEPQPLTSTPEAPRVILAALPGAAPGRELILALAARGQSIVLWLVPGGAVAEADADAVLELQLAIAGVGGISLAHEETSLTAPAEAFGRIDLALATSEVEAGAMARAAAELERDRRPGRLLILLGDEEPAGVRPLAAGPLASVAAPPGMKVSALGTAGLTVVDLAGRIGDWLAT